MNKKSRKAATSSAASGKFFSSSEERVRAKYGIWGSAQSAQNDLPNCKSLVDPEQDLGETDHLNRSVLFYYLVPVVGFFPSLWTLYRRRGTKEQIIVSRLSVTLAFGWLLGNLLLKTGAQTTESIALPLLLVSTVLTSSYFAISVWLMIRLWQRRSLQIPGISHVADQVVGRHL